MACEQFGYLLGAGLRKRLDICSPVREYPREMLTATVLYFLDRLVGVDVAVPR